MSSVITNKSVKPFIIPVDFFPGFKLEEECFSKAVIKDVDSKSRKKDQEVILYPRLKPTAQIVYENFLEQVINPKTGEYYPQKDDDGRSIKGTGATYYITDIYRIRRGDGSEYLYTKGRVFAYNSLGDQITHFISKPEIWTRTNFTFKTEFDSKTNQLEKVFQGISGTTLEYTTPFNKENLKQLYDRRQNENLGLAVKDEVTEKAFQVKDVTGNLTKSYELLRDQSFDYLFGGNHIPQEIKAELRAAAVADGLIGGNIADYNQPAKSSAPAVKNTYQ